MEKQIKLVRYIAIRYADPICAIDLTDKCLLYGTMLGTVACYFIDQKKLITLSETQEEHISGVKIQENKENPKENKLFACVSDDKIFIYDYNAIMENYNDIPKHEEIHNYTSENEHSQKCERCFTMLKNDYLVRTFIEFPQDTRTESAMFDTPFAIKSINNLNIPEIMGSIKMTNYSVPFDFDGKNYIFIDFLEEKKRMFNIYNIESKDFIKSFEIEKYKEKIGHISLLKILNNDLMFLVRDYSVCEIRDMNFEIKKCFNYRGNEILAFDVIYNDENNFETLKIILLDIECNVFIYHYRLGKQEFLFNLNHLEDIEQIIKDQRFFSMGYPYYIKVSKQFIAISSDYGCILVQYSFS
jgi:hypothetical protein